LKRAITQKTGPGDTLAFSSDKEAWYYVDSIYNDEFFGSVDVAKGDDTVNTGFIVKINLPEALVADLDT